MYKIILNLNYILFYLLGFQNLKLVQGDGLVVWLMFSIKNILGSNLLVSKWKSWFVLYFYQGMTWRYYQLYVNWVCYYVPLPQKKKKKKVIILEILHK